MNNTFKRFINRIVWVTNHICGVPPYIPDWIEYNGETYFSLVNNEEKRVYISYIRMSNGNPIKLMEVSSRFAVIAYWKMLMMLFKWRIL